MISTSLPNISRAEEAVVYRSPVGELRITADGDLLTGVRAAREGDGPPVSSPSSVLQAVVRWLDRYFAGARSPAGEFPSIRCGTPFQRLVWELVSRIPYGEVTSYREIARRVSSKTGRRPPACQAIGSAVARNPFLVIVPCHRVIGSDGALTGYAGGIEMKRALLLHEGAFFPSAGDAFSPAKEVPDGMGRR